MATDLPENRRGEQAIVLSAVFTALSFVCVGSRLFTRLHFVKNAGLDDLSVTMAWVSLLRCQTRDLIVLTSFQIFTFGLTIAIYYRKLGFMSIQILTAHEK